MDCSLLIIGAGPYGLAMAAMARHLGIETTVTGKPLEFWERHTPPGMLLRSGWDWHIDPLEDHTFQRFLHEHGGPPPDTEPLTREVLLRYFEWFTEEKGIEIVPHRVRNLRHSGDGFLAILDDGRTVAARFAVAAPGFAPFAFWPPELTAMLPSGSYSHACDAFDLGSLAGRRCLIVGGRQSAFEWAALIAEQGAQAVHVVYRHPTPSFTPSDWTWVRPYLDRTVAEPRWFCDLDEAQREEIRQRFWTEGRLKLEPWLDDRLRRPEISLHPESRVLACRSGDDCLEIELSDLKDGTSLEIDHVILATGYRMDLTRIDYLRAGSLLEDIAADGGYPQLDEHFECSVPGLFFAGFPTMQAFGPFFGFLVGAPATAKVIAGHLAHRFE